MDQREHDRCDARLESGERCPKMGKDWIDVTQRRSKKPWTKHLVCGTHRNHFAGVAPDAPQDRTEEYEKARYDTEHIAAIMDAMLGVR